jgi:subtilisin family serine protease
MRRLAERPTPWRYLVIALLVLAFLLLLRWIDEDDHAARVTPPVPVSLDHAGCTATVDVHFKLKPGATTALAAQPLFTHLPATAAAVDDPRARWRRIDIPAGHAAAFVAALDHDPAVEEAFVAPEVTLPEATPQRDRDSCPITTPSFEHYQEWVGPAPAGVDAPAAWRRGVRGQGVWFADVEGGWNANHEDLPGDRIRHVAGQPINDPQWRMHGTAVLGEVVGKDNGKGVVGLAPDVDRVFTASIGRLAVADALDAAAEQLRPGDVLLIELQGTGPRGRFLPVEYWNDNFDAIQAATRRGVVIVEAAGNGGEDLDRSTYRGKLSRKGRDSGAIMVGAGGPPRQGFIDRARLDFSNYGSRVDVQGWGRKVATLDYGDLQRCDDPGDRHYTGEFSGTSRAPPIAAGAAGLVESWSRANRGKPLAPAAVRDLLRRTGTPQAAGIGGRGFSSGFACTSGGCVDFAAEPPQQIGPRPDLARALAALEK